MPLLIRDLLLAVACALAASAAFSSARQQVPVQELSRLRKANEQLRVECAKAESLVEAGFVDQQTPLRLYSCHTSSLLLLKYVKAPVVCVFCLVMLILPYVGDVG